MAFDLLKELKRIDEHFKNIDLEQFEKDLIECGFGKIKPGPLAMDDTITEKDTAIYNNIKMMNQVYSITSHESIIINVDLRNVITYNEIYCKSKKRYKFEEDVMVSKESDYIINIQQSGLHICNNYEVA